MREVELKAIVDDADAARNAIRRAGATLAYEGRLEDRRYDTPEFALRLRDQVLRLRVYRAATVRAMLDWKGPTAYESGYKVREELSTTAGDPDALATLLERLGYVVTREIDRRIEQYQWEGATIRFEHYPRMDVLVEVEGEPSAIERAIAALAMPREAFTTQRLPDFVRLFEERTGERAAICDRELQGDYRYSATDA
ncbi:MAG: class IV adenylate cyclase [Gemmatimonadaceae bacterium]|jgi:predicted adenylyl cyclase CyaB|nr:class IV adenylate cyclase [Gemmatimonadaceae bacterium]